MCEQEINAASTILTDLVSHFTEIVGLFGRIAEDSEAVLRNPLWETAIHSRGAIQLAGVHRVATCLPLLRRLEPLDYSGYSRISIAMGGQWRTEHQSFRPILHHSLLLLNEEPQGYAAYHFTSEDGRLRCLSM